ncbi:hypothetical protein ACJX0J_031377, partial [Zea mays]
LEEIFLWAIRYRVNAAGLLFISYIGIISLKIEIHFGNIIIHHLELADVKTIAYTEKKRSLDIHLDTSQGRTKEYRCMYTQAIIKLFETYWDLVFHVDEDTLHSSSNN